jgi:PAS domain S-box-containing protein
MPKFSRFSLRNRALILVLLSILPLLALTLYAYFDQRSRAIREVQKDELVAARNMANTLENLFSNTNQLLTALARLPEVQRHDRAACASLLAGVLGQCPYYAVLLVVDSQGQLLASAPVAPGPVNYADRPWFQQVVQAKALVISEPIIGRFTKKYVYNLAFPILDEAGRFQGAVTAGIDLQWLGGLLAKSDFPPITAIVLSDASHKVFFRYPEPLKYTGKMIPDFIIKDMTGRDEGVSAGVGLPGDERLFAFARLSPPWQEMWVFFGLPRDWAVGPVNRALERNLIFLGLVALFAMAAAWYGAGLFIVQPVKRLLTVTERLAAGDLSLRSGPDHPPGELGLLAHAFDQMADSLQGREATLKESSEDLNRAQAVAQTGSWRLDLRRNELLWSEETYRMFGVPPGTPLTYEIFLSVVHPEDKEFVDREWTAALCGRPYDIEHRIVVGDKVKWVRERAKLDFDPQGALLRGFGTVQDITERKWVELERLKFVLLADNSNEFIGMCDMQFTPFYVNQAGLDMVGLDSLEQACTMPVKEFFFPDDQRFIYEEFFPRVVKEGRGEVEIRFRHFKTGEPLWMIYNVFFIKNADNQAVGLATVSRNISERKQAEEELERTRHQMAEGQRIAHLGSWEYIAATQTTVWSDEEKRIYGLDPAQPSPEYEVMLRHHIHPHDAAELDRSFRTALQHSAVFDHENRIIRPDGTVRWIYNKAQPYFDEHGKLLSYIGATLDIS